MANITAEQIKTFFDGREESLNDGKIDKYSLVIAKYEDNSFRSGINCTICVPRGLVAIVEYDEDTDAVFVPNEPHSFRQVSQIWIVRRYGEDMPWSDAPWGIGGILYTDITTNSKIKFGANGAFNFRIRDYKKWVKEFRNYKEVSNLDIRNYLKNHTEMVSQVTAILTDYAKRYGFDKLDQSPCKEEIQKKLNENLQYLANGIELKNFTIEKTIDYFI